LDEHAVSSQMENFVATAKNIESKVQHTKKVKLFL
jgi:hypothetical protein